MLSDTIAIILAGGVGSRLHPLTSDRAKPGVPFGGKYRIIDFTLSNCHHSGLRRILVLTQYKSHSLQKHLRDGWSIFNPSIGEFITPVPPQMRTGDSWYAGTADAVFQNLYLLERSGAARVLILSGDHIYRMDYAAMLNFHRAKQADATIACMAVRLAEASAFGILAVDASQRVVSFREKPRDPQPIPDDPSNALASMGIYAFPCDLLCQLLKEDHERSDSSHDFGKDLLPRLIQTHSVYGYRFGTAEGRVTSDRYWRDVGTIDSYFESNMDLLRRPSPIDLYQPNWTIRTSEAQAPPARIVDGASGAKPVVDNAMLGSGSIVEGATVRSTILYRNVTVAEQAVVEQSLLFDGVRVGPGVRLRKCIVDKGVTIPAGEMIGFNAEQDRARFTVSEDGVVVIPKLHRFE